jgi:hypothetical protein
MYGFEVIAATVIATAEAKTMGLCPLVRPEELAEFEDFAYNTAFTEINRNYPNDTGLRDFNDDGVLTRGVHGFDQNLEIYRETDAHTVWNSTYDILTPIIMHLAGPPILMFNLHSMKQFGVIVDELLDCAWGGAVADNNQTGNGQDENVPLADSSFLNQCSMLSDVIIMYDKCTYMYWYCLCV